MFEFSNQIAELKSEEARLSEEIGILRTQLKEAREDLKKFRKARTQLEKISGIISDDVNIDDDDEADDI